MTSHPTKEELERFLTARLEPDEQRRVARCGQPAVETEQGSRRTRAPPDGARIRRPPSSPPV